MKRTMIIVFALTIFLIPGISSAQMQRGGKGQGMMGQQMHQGGQGYGTMNTGMHAHMAQMAEMMNKMAHMMGKWQQMTREQKEEMMNIMGKMSHMMENMSMAQGGQLQPEQQKQLDRTQKSLDNLYDQVGH